MAQRSDYRRFYRMETRWMDNGAFRHLNNVSYFSFFDTAVARCLLECGYLDIARSPVIGLVAETKGRFHRRIAFPDSVQCGLRVAQLGRSSVRIEIGLFRDEDDAAAAEGHFVHVYVERESGRPVAKMPEPLQMLFDSLRTPPLETHVAHAPRRAGPESRGGFVAFLHHTTRWMDSDAYRHMNNIVYYSFFDTAITRLLLDGGFLHWHQGAAIGMAAESQCSFFSPIAFPDDVVSGLRVAHIGRSSVRYELALFRNQEETASAQGHFVQVLVDGEGGRPVAIPAPLRAWLERSRRHVSG